MDKNMRSLMAIFGFFMIFGVIFGCEPGYCEEGMKGDAVMISVGKTVKFDYVLTTEEQKIDSSEQNGPLEYVHGDGKIIKGLEKELEGLSVGDKKTVVVSPEEGYGEIKQDAFKEFPKSEFPQNVPLKAGQMISVGTPDGMTFPAMIEEVKEESVILNLNHPLAGKELKFDVTIVEIN
ncbi:MAG: peptidylprolyl isomerase [PVC group bacterium]|nr:peptidylprolyl isomerase [PVC group bacterium]